ncbi:MAG: hypothetical protein JKY22_11930 [Flavobacteriaceae bacterium]|nr:hypothetical protein [Flavobacteriaceae bacterium]
MNKLLILFFMTISLMGHSQRTTINKIDQGGGKFQVEETKVFSDSTLITTLSVEMTEIEADDLMLFKLDEKTQDEAILVARIADATALLIRLNAELTLLQN